MPEGVRVIRFCCFQGKAAVYPTLTPQALREGAATIRPCAPLFINLKYLTIDFCKVLYYNRGKKNSARFDGNNTADSRSGTTERRAGGKEGIELCPHPDSPAEWKTR